MRRKQLTYHEWLCSQVSIQGPDYSYFLLMKDLDDFEFQVVVELDDNRVGDAMELRYQYLEEIGDPDGEIEGPCSVLEMLIAFARRATFIADEVNDTNKWFWIFLDNLGLHGFTDDKYDSEAVKHILWVFVNRRYTKTGKGGLFPMKRHIKTDQRLLELWYQLAQFLDERRKNG